MTDRLVELVLPASFVVRRVALTPEELAYGYRQGWLGDRDVIEIALAALKSGASLTAGEEELALLLSDEVERVPRLVEQLAPPVEVDDPNTRPVWVFLVLAWLYDHRFESDDPLGVVELVYADFGYPEEIEGLVRFLPEESGTGSGVEEVLRRWQKFVSSKSAEYRERRR
jgi:hypothetical protein